jgi:NAD-dependent deacetylase
MSTLRQIAAWLAESSRAVAFTGAGISTESGVPDFRSPQGIWAKSTPVEYKDFLDSEEARLEYWRQKAVAHRDFMRSTPNAGHRVLADWEARGRLRAVITQNIDEFHQQAGSRRVLELHGTARKIKCLDCDAFFDAGPLVTAYEATGAIPRCESCGSRLMKHATISFGQSLERETLAAAMQLSREADLFFALGSSLVVYPAAGLPQLAKQNGARLVIINREETPLDDIADIVLHEPLGAALEAISAIAFA